MKIGIIDVDSHNFPNIALMKLSAYHKVIGDSVEWYEPLFSCHMDRVYMSKVFTFTEDYDRFIDAGEVVKSGTGYFYPDGGNPLPEEIEHIYPDYGIYGITNTAYGFLTRGCPQNCEFCIVGKKEGLVSVKVADISEWWRGQKYIELMDPNLLACKDHICLLEQLRDSKSWINVNQGADARMLTEKNAELIIGCKIKNIHFAWDKYEKRDIIIPKLKMFKEMSGWDKRKLTVYVLTNFNTTHDQDLDRIYTLRGLGYWPYVMVYDKEKLPKGHITRKVQRWVNSRAIFESVKSFKDYLK